ncbi:ATP-binding cassette subfamily F protein uup [Humitalea rosea]|uniref:ATP-binding cassette subfamily F protein uup n=2 Tax=Humitalea rosea TaxID=990373 RepID=A0A2W7I174_9PROT|nr:ATP-binding cassette subfamily F protein uup [Humitalea rosea]
MTWAAGRRTRCGMAPPLLLLSDITLGFGDTKLLQGATLSVSTGEKVALVGRNGSGKSTLLRIAAGTVQQDKGTRFVQPGATLRVLAQEPDMSGFATVEDYLLAGLDPGASPHRMIAMLHGLGLDGSEDPKRLSGGEAKRAALVRVIAPNPDILLLDEPTNHLDLPAIEWLEETLLGFRGALVLISHDRRFLERLSRSMVWLDRGTTRRLEQGFSAFEPWRDQVLEEEETQAHKHARKIAREEDWLRYGVTARRKRNVKRLADLHELRKVQKERRGPTGVARITAADGAGSGSLVISAEEITKAFDGRKVIDHFSTRVLRGDRIGIIGPNGAGKTTLLNLLTGRMAPDEGQVKLGTALVMVTLDQTRAALDPSKGVAETLTGGQGDMVEVGDQRRHVIGYMKDFLFSPDQARTPVSALSGGERGRLLLAAALAKPANLLVLDEPTNDLDLETLDLLQEVLAEHPATILLVSHDRDVLDRVATSTIAWEGEGHWQEYAGGYSDMVAQRGAGVTARGAVTREKAAAAAPPPPPPPSRRRLSPKEQHALATLPARIAGLTAIVARRQAALQAARPAEMAKAAIALNEAQAALDGAEEDWLRVELVREEVEG